MPKKKPEVAFDVPTDVGTASQSGWVYRSDAAASPAGSPESAASPAGSPESAAPLDGAPAAAAAMAVAAPEVLPAGGVTRAPVAGVSWADRVTELLALPFSVPICFILSLAPQSRRANPK
jgi:hypothetical protein